MDFIDRMLLGILWNDRKKILQFVFVKNVQIST